MTNQRVSHSPYKVAALTARLPGGQWAIQGPIIMPAAPALGADEARVIMAVAWGDAWTNMIQPFWALPALAVAGLSVRDIMGFCVMVLLVSSAVLIPGLMFLP